jgi:hypothetical protein
MYYWVEDTILAIDRHCSKGNAWGSVVQRNCYIKEMIINWLGNLNATIESISEGCFAI